MKSVVFIILSLTCSLVFGQNEQAYLEIQKIQDQLNEHYSNPETSILLPKDLKVFKALNFYPIDLKFRVVAEFVRTPDEKPFLMPTSTERTPEYVKYGEAHFSLDGKNFVLNLFQNTAETKVGEADYLFLPFTDLTSGVDTYGGGRYIDQKIPEGNSIIIDFNQSYNPYCAYNPRYSCPIPPPENDLLIEIMAGVKDFKQN